MVLPEESHQNSKKSKASKKGDSIDASDAYLAHQANVNESKNLKQSRPIEKSKPKLRNVMDREVRWEEMFNRLLMFRDENGHCQVPNRYEKDPKLGIWVSTQRRQYKVLFSKSSKSTSMTIERAKRLQQVGFDWAPKDPRTVPWETRFKELMEFVAKYGHAQVPMRMKGNHALSNWVSTQRHEYRLLQKGLPSRLTSDRVSLLEGVGFVWEPKRGAPGSKLVQSIAQASAPLSSSEARHNIDFLTNTIGSQMPFEAPAPASTTINTNSSFSGKERDMTSVEREMEMMQNLMQTQPMEIRTLKQPLSSGPGTWTQQSEGLDPHTLAGAGEVWQNSQSNSNDTRRPHAMIPMPVQPTSPIAAGLIQMNRSIMTQINPPPPEEAGSKKITSITGQFHDSTAAEQTRLAFLSHNNPGQTKLTPFAGGDTNLSSITLIPDSFKEFLRHKQSQGSTQSNDSPPLHDNKPSAILPHFEPEAERKKRENC